MGVTVGIVGVGLLGGSVAAAAKSRGVADRVVGYGRDPARLEACRAAGLIDEGRVSFAGTDDLDVAVVCTPVGRIAEDVRGVAADCRADAVITDVGSVKASVVTGLSVDPPATATFVGAHPLAGSERQGFEHADAGLFDGRVCVVTPGEADRGDVDRVAAFWRSLGARVIEMKADAHDRALAFTSHLPHLAASALAATVADEADLVLAGTGFADTTRIAGGDPGLWADIVATNRAELLAALRTYAGALSALADAVEGDNEGVRMTLEAGVDARRRFESLSR